MSRIEYAYHTTALKEWGKLYNSWKLQFKKKLAERLINPHIKSRAENRPHSPQNGNHGAIDGRWAMKKSKENKTNYEISSYRHTDKRTL